MSFVYGGDRTLREPIGAALRRVIDPEMAVNIVDLGLVYEVVALERRVEVRITMTSAACPVSEIIVDDVESELAAALGGEHDVKVELVWDPPWTPERMSERARACF